MAKQRAAAAKLKAVSKQTADKLEGIELYSFEMVGRYIKYLAQQMVDAKLERDALGPWTGHLSGMLRLVELAGSWTMAWAQLNHGIADCNTSDPINWKVAKYVASLNREFPYVRADAKTG